MTLQQFLELNDLEKVCAIMESGRLMAQKGQALVSFGWHGRLALRPHPAKRAAERRSTGMTGGADGGRTHDL